MLCSGGGCMYTMCAALDFLRKTPVKIHATGQCMSAALPILAAGSWRTASPLTRFMVHPGRMLMEADRVLADIKHEGDELERLEEIYCAALARTTKKPAKWWSARAAETYYFGAEEALGIGLIDAIA